MANKLELTWYGKEETISVEPRLLIENPELSNTEKDENTENMLIHGDNLLALKALEAKYAGKIKCVYIDPPYNTGSAFEQYDDNLEHSKWLNLMRPRLEILRNLLSDNGSIWISIDDDEHAYLKVLCDEVFGRSNFVNSVIWEKRYAPTNDSKWLSDSHDFILVYARNKEMWRPNLLPRGEQQNKYYKYDDGDGRGRWRSDNVLVRTFSKSGVFGIVNPNTGEEYYPPEGSCYRFSKETAERYLQENRFYFGKDGKGAPQLKRYLSEVKQGVTPMTIWKREEVSDNQEAKKEVKVFNSESVFATPKPERLIERVLTLATNEGDFVLDSFLGSGTTAAVAQKMNRKYIGIEMGEHIYSHCKVRMDMVISGEDQGGISSSHNWTGGGAYRFYELAPSLINKDEFDELVINKEYDADMLAAAVAIHEGFTYNPDDSTFWKQSYGNENSYLYVTTNHVSSNTLDAISTMMSEEEYLIIACKTFDANASKQYERIVVKKIPQMLLDRCQFGVTDYALNIVCPPIYEEEEDYE